MVPEVDLHTFAAAHSDGALVIDVRSVTGGTGDWVARGLPVVRGAQENVA